MQTYVEAPVERKRPIKKFVFFTCFLHLFLCCKYVVSLICSTSISFAGQGTILAPFGKRGKHLKVAQRKGKLVSLLVFIIFPHSFVAVYIYLSTSNKVSMFTGITIYINYFSCQMDCPMGLIWLIIPKER